MLKFTVPATSDLILVFLVPLLIMALTGCSSRPEPAELILIHGKLVTVDDTLAEAEALAARGGRIVRSDRTKRSRSTVARTRVSSISAGIWRSRASSKGTPTS